MRSIKITYREEDSPIEYVEVPSQVSARDMTVSICNSNSICVRIIDVGKTTSANEPIIISNQDAADLGAALIKLANQS